MRGCLWLEPQGKLVPFATAVFRGLLGATRTSQGRGAGGVCSQCGIDAPAFFAGIAQDDIKAQLKANTDELIRRGGFGSPTIYVNGDDMYRQRPAAAGARRLAARTNLIPTIPTTPGTDPMKLETIGAATRPDPATKAVAVPSTRPWPMPSTTRSTAPTCST